MSLIRTLIRPNIKHIQILTSQPIKKCHWFPAYKPGPPPKTKEEREAAAQKYNMLPEEYEPDDDYGSQSLGDYPKVPFESCDSRDLYYPWDYHNLKRDYLQPVNRHEHLLVPQMLTTVEPQHTMKECWIILFKFCAFAALVAYCSDRFLNYYPGLEQQKLGTDEIHYTFELDYSKKK
ncbi:hypothetical protein RUM44_012721 [Polyplax serrata]|uniref:NADH dehydrogenase [ubiquinone] 1 beta subcomplex subunit 8, mitochondrial n=1 Tax=Polyplax serrata TaxID=468196 RepID=A0ABR1BGB7_POLSC